MNVKLLHQIAHLVTLRDDKFSICIFKETRGIVQDVEGLNKWNGLMVYVVVQGSDGCANKITWELWSDFMNIFLSRSVTRPQVFDVLLGAVFGSVWIY